MKNYSANSIFGTILSIFLLASCMKKDPDFKSAFKDNVDPKDLTTTYTWKKSNVSSTPPVVEVTPAMKRPVGIFWPDTSKVKHY